MALTVARSFDQMVTDTTNVRDVSEQMVLLEPDAAPLFVLTNAAKRKQPTIGPRFEWVEDTEVSLWGQSSATVDWSSAATNVLVSDGTLFGVGDICAVPKTQSSSAAPEVFLVTAVSTNTLTITRGVGSAGADTLPATGSIRILASAFREDDSLGTQRYTAKTVQISYAQIFKTPVKITHTAASTKQYGAPQGERKFQLVKSLIRHRSEIEAAGLWSRASESLATPSSRWTTMGWLSRIATNKTDASTTATITTWNNFAETAFRYGEKQKLLLCAPRVISALNFYSQNKLLTRVGDTVFGVKIARFEMALGEFLLANDYRLGTSDVGFPGGNSFSNHAYSIDLPSVAMRYLQGGGDNLIGDTKLYENVLPDGSTTRTDEYRSQLGWEIRHERKHAWLYDLSAYS
ncbi:MAG TPA: hypothetical protein VFU86_01650 [Terriglobales bacterium]|nr:hypothetical protein [Terriglobales bacterium]